MLNDQDQCLLNDQCLENIYFFISQSSLYCIALGLYVLKLQSFDYKTKHLNIILLSHYLEIKCDNWYEWYVYHFMQVVCYTQTIISYVFTGLKDGWVGVEEFIYFWSL